MGRADAIRRLATVCAVLVYHVFRGGMQGLQTRSWAPVGHWLVHGFERLGPAFIKLGQFLSVRPDLVPPELVIALESLQDRAASVPLRPLLEVVESELGAPTDRLFRTFEPEPLASASLSQVHKARLPSGVCVAVKIQRPGAAEALRRDLSLAGRLARVAVALSPLRGRVDVAALWDELLETAERELDFRYEAEVAEEMSRNFRNQTGIQIPRVYWGWTTRRVLTTEFVPGVKISDAAARSRRDYEGLAEAGARAFLKQVLDDGLFHADLHPANLLITPEGNIAYLDFGITGRLSPPERDAVLGALAGLLTRDALLAVRHLARLGVRVPPEEVQAFSEDVGRVMDRSIGPRLCDVSVGRIGRGILGAVHRHGVTFPRRHALLVKALITIEGTARLLHPDFSFEHAARRYLFEMAKKDLSLRKMLEATWRVLALVGLAVVDAALPETPPAPPFGGKHDRQVVCQGH